MITVTRRFTFSAGHRLAFHEGGCSELHGHNYTVEVTFSRHDGSLDENGMVVDFGIVKRAIGDWLDANWDHALVLEADDTKAIEAAGAAPFRMYTMSGPPTAENMARYLLEDIIPPLLEKHVPDVEAEQVVVWENENSKATASL